MEHQSSALRRFNSIMKETEQVYHEAALALGVSDSAMGILYALRIGDGSLPLRDVRLVCGLTKQTVNSSLRKLEEEGILYLEPMDGREKIVRLTPQGRVLSEQTAGRIMDVENAVFGSWTQEQVTAYLESMERFLTQLREKCREEFDL